MEHIWATHSGAGSKQRLNKNLFQKDPQEHTVSPYPTQHTVVRAAPGTSPGALRGFEAELCGKQGALVFPRAPSNFPARNSSLAPRVDRCWAAKHKGALAAPW